MKRSTPVACRWRVPVRAWALLLCAACTAPAPIPWPIAPSSQPMAAPTTDTGPTAGSLEASIGGLAITPGGNNGFVNGAFAIGWYASADVILSVRHLGSFSDNGEDNSYFSDRIAVDFAGPPRGVSPFVGLGIGVAYGESVNETVLAGLHAGARIFIKPSTFVQLLGGYDHFVSRTEDRTEVFEDAVSTFTLSFGVTF